METERNHTHTVTSNLLPLSIHLGDPCMSWNGYSDRRGFELRLGEHVIYKDSVWAGGNPMKEATAAVASRLRDLLVDGALIQYEED
jgi:hypothetical protein